MDNTIFFRTSDGKLIAITNIITKEHKPLFGKAGFRISYELAYDGNDPIDLKKYHGEVDEFLNRELRTMMT